MFRLGVDKDDEKAVFWFKKAAQMGYSLAQNSLRFMYEQGRGISKNESQAFYWYKLASAQGHKGARSRMIRLLAH